MRVLSKGIVAGVHSSNEDPWIWLRFWPPSSLAGACRGGRVSAFGSCATPALLVPCNSCACPVRLCAELCLASSDRVHHACRRRAGAAAEASRNCSEPRAEEGVIITLQGQKKSWARWNALANGLTERESSCATRQERIVCDFPSRVNLQLRVRLIRCGAHLSFHIRIICDY